MINIADEFRNIAASFSALIEGLSYMDIDVAEKLADEFSEKLIESSRSVFAEMAVKISEELGKPKKTKRRRKKVATVEVPVHQAPLTEHEEFSEASIGNQELPFNEHSFLGGKAFSADVLDSGFQDELTGTGVTDRAANYPPTRDQGGRGQPSPPTADGEGRRMQHQTRIPQRELEEREE